MVHAAVLTWQLSKKSDKRPMRDLNALFLSFFICAQFDLLTYASQPYDAINLAPCMFLFDGPLSQFVEAEISRISSPPYSNVSRVHLSAYLTWQAAARKKEKNVKFIFKRHTAEKKTYTESIYEREFLYPQIWAMTTTSGREKSIQNHGKVSKYTHVENLFTYERLKLAWRREEVNSMLVVGEESLWKTSDEWMLRMVEI